MNLPLVASVYAVIFVAELPDKTALASLVLATRYEPLPVFVGACLALTLQSVVAVASGSLLSLLPTRPVHLLAGAVFLVSAILMWRRDAGDQDDNRHGNAQAAGFASALTTVSAVVFIAEWGDLTQLGTAALAARYHSPLEVFAGATLALWSVVGIAVFLGNRAARWVPVELTQRLAAVVFAGVGIALAGGWI